MSELLTSDGVRLHVETTGPADAPVTILLSHGWTCSTRTWHHQMTDLPQLLGDSARVIAYDQRGHGRSAAAPAGTTRIDRLAYDVVEVLEAEAPSGPVVYAGHSMGGMSVMALAELEPDLVAERLAGLVLVSTSAGQVTSQPFGLPRRFDKAAALIGPHLMSAAGRRSDRRARKLGDQVRFPALQRPVLRRMAFGARPDPVDVDILAGDIARTPGPSLSGFFSAIADHDRTAALPVFGGIPVEVMHGTRDRLIGPRHANRLAHAIPRARLWMYPGAGHMLMQERHRDVTHRLASLARHAASR